MVGSMDARSPEARDRAFATLAKLNRPEAPPRTAAATAARMRGREERAAALLRDRGWGVVPPEVLASGSEMDLQNVLYAGVGRG